MDLHVLIKIMDSLLATNRLIEVKLSPSAFIIFTIRSGPSR